MKAIDEIVIRFGKLEAAVSTFGASLRRYSGPRGSVWGYQGKENKKGGQGDVLIPFPGRIAGGKYSFEGQSYQLQKNDKDGPNAIHGFLRSVQWEVSEKTDTRARFVREIRADEFEGYPFRIRAQLTYTISESGLNCGFEVKNLGSTRAPVGIGFHPYFTVGTRIIDEAQLFFPAESLIEFQKNLLPTGRVVSVEGTDVDFRKSRTIGAVQINHCFTDLRYDASGIAHAELAYERGKISVWMDRSFPYVVLYTGDQIPGASRRALAIEPMTCATDAFNRPQWGLKTLSPDETFSGAYGIL